MSGYEAVYRRSIEQPEAFWGEAASGIDWDTAPRTVYADGRWYPDGRLNTCHNALDRHVAAGRGDQPALIHDSPVTGVTRTYTYAELLEETARTAGMLRALGVTAGDTVVIYMPMVPQAVVAMLACARLGAVHSVVFGGFAARELAVRIDHAQPKVVLSASCGIEPSRVVAYKPLLDDALEQAAHRPERCVILQRPQCRAGLAEGRDLDWAEAVAAAEPAGCVSVAATDPLYILYTSGTTGAPKGVVRDNGGHAVALHWSMANVYGAAPGEVYWAASDVGWVVGHSYIVYAPLLAGCTTVLYEGKPVGTPDPGAFWRVVAEHGVRTLFTAPTAIRAIKKEDPSGAFAKKYDLSGLRHLFLAGERLDPDTYHWASDLLGIPVIDHWWQTETGWPIAANCVGIEPLPIKPGSPTKPVPGWDVHVLDADGRDCPPGVEGAVTVRLPLPPGAPAHPLPRPRSLRPLLPRPLPRPLPHRRRRPLRRRRPPLCHGPHRRRHQRGRPPAVHRLDGGGHRRTPRRRRVRRDRRRRRAEGPAPHGVRGAQGGCGPRPRGGRAGADRPRTRAHRPGRRLPPRRRGVPAAEDPIGQDPARHHARHRRRPPVHRPVHHRGSRGAAGDRDGVEGFMTRRFPTIPANSLHDRDGQRMMGHPQSPGRRP
ncbi:hypothetical protein GCM10020001_090800 [Nonomuraea salmonea]